MEATRELDYGREKDRTKRKDRNKVCFLTRRNPVSPPGKTASATILGAPTNTV
jgi:hypothetical protein